MNAPDPHTAVRRHQARPIDSAAEVDSRAAWFDQHIDWHRLARMPTPPAIHTAGTWSLLASCAVCWLIVGLAVWAIWPDAP